jgi:SAM-dependent methyltransferase
LEKEMKAYLVPGLTSRGDLNILYEWAKLVPENGVIVEIGSFLGRTAVALAEGAPASTKIYCIDYFSDYFNKMLTKDNNFCGDDDFWKIGKIYNTKEEFVKFTKDYGNIIQLVLERPNKVYPYQGELIDLLFLDCAHYNPDDLMNIQYFKKFLKPNAVICGHDYHPRFPDVIKNVKILEIIYKTKAILYESNSMWAIRT